ncbi:MAG: hypothetical protein M1468_04885 [Candidatus Thermoplasmatota archaeon]|jgi:hypothetical protein|nr:hypothetical protein [Candidatus Thermoplasmatota archaeon]
MMWIDNSSDSYVEEADSWEILAHKDGMTSDDHDCQDILFFQDVTYGKESGYR